MLNGTWKLVVDLKFSFLKIDFQIKDCLEEYQQLTL